MAEFNQFGSVNPGHTGDPQHCAQCEAMLTDVLDGTLSPADQATFNLHLAGCPRCSAMLADARRGAAWMDMLHSPRPEPSANLLERILAQTSGQTDARVRNQASLPIALEAGTGPQTQRPQNTLLGHPIPVQANAIPNTAYPSAKVIPFRTRITQGFRSLGQTMLQPRLAMTAAMAFFSIALTLNLTGIRLSELRASDLKPSNIMRGCYEAKAKVVRYSDNLRVVYELESRVRDLQQSSDQTRQADPVATPATKSDPEAQPGKPTGNPQQPGDHDFDPKQNRPRPNPKSNPGSSRREIPGGSIRQVDSLRQSYALPAATEALVVAPNAAKPEGALV